MALYGSPLWTLLIACGLILMFKAILLARARRHGSPKARVAAGWNAIRMLAEQSGITAKGTRRDQAGAIARQLGTDDQALIQLGREADYATFSGQDIESGKPPHIGQESTNYARQCSLLCRVSGGYVHDFP